MVADHERIVTAVRAVLFVLVLIVVAVLAWANGWGDYLFGEGGMDRLSALVGENYLQAALLYVASVVIGGTLLAVPGFVFAIAAGVLFGPFWGLVLCVAAGTLTAIVSFIAGRTFLKDFVKPIAMRNRYIRKWLFDDADRSAVVVLLVTRMVPVVPYNMQNFAYGVTDMKLSTYSWGTFLFMIPGTAAYTFGAAGLVNEEQRVLYLVIAVVLAVLVTGIGVLLYRRYMR